MFWENEKYRLPSSLDDQSLGVRTNAFLNFGLVVSLLAGAWIRFYKLDIWPLGVDEYYIIQSVKNIVHKGLPAFDTGGYYVRGLIYQYLTALLVILGVKLEIAARIWPAIANLLSIPAVYFLTRKISNKFFAVVLVFVFSFSIWEIEMARFARMYAPFQAIFLWYLFFLYQFVVEKNPKSLKWIIILSFISIFIFEASIFLCVINFVPLVWNRKFDKKQFFFSILIFIIGYIYLTFDFTHLDVQNYLPNDVNLINVKHAPIQIPILLFLFFKDSFWLLLLLPFVLFNFYSGFQLLKSHEFSAVQKSSGLILILLALFNQFGLLLYVFFLLLLVNWINIKDLTNKKFRNIVISIGCILCFWVVSGLMGVEWNNLPQVESTKKIVKTFVSLFNYPQIYYYFKEYLRSIPIFTLLTSLILGFVFVIALLKHNINQGYKFLVFILLLSIIVAIVVSTDIVRSRYLFFLFPLILILTVCSLQYLLSNLNVDMLKSALIFVPVLILYLIASEDFNLDHLLNVSNPQKNYRLLYEGQKAGHFFETTFDSKAPAVYVNNHSNGNDIVIADEVSFEYYLHKLDYIYSDYRSPRTRNFSAAGGTIERWSNSKMIYLPEKLFELFNSQTTVWFITGSETNNRMYLEENNFYSDFGKYLVYKSPDGYFNVYKVVK